MYLINLTVLKANDFWFQERKLNFIKCIYLCNVSRTSTLNAMKPGFTQETSTFPVSFNVICDQRRVTQPRSGHPSKSFQTGFHLPKNLTQFRLSRK